MPFDLILPVLGCCFVSAWVFIGGMLVQDSLDRSRHIRFDTPSDRDLKARHIA